MLGLVIERPSYGLELFNRYQRRYAETWPVSAASHVYAALDALRDRGLIESMATAVDGDRQPKPHYRATRLGVRSYEDWLVEQVDQARRRQELLVRQLGTFVQSPPAALRVLSRLERQCLQTAGDGTAATTAATSGSREELVDWLVAERQRLDVGGTLAWLRHAAGIFEALASGGERDESAGA